MIDQIERLLPDYLVRQRWFGEAGDVAVAGVEWAEVDGEAPPLLRGIVTVEPGGARYQVLVGLRPLSDTETFLEGKGRAFLGDVDGEDGPLLAYDAVVDPDLAARLLAVVAPGEEAGVVRPVQAEASNTLVVFDDRLVLKVFRRLHDGPNPDVEVGEALAAVGFEGVPEQVAAWHDGERHLAVVRRYLTGAVDAWEMARTSVRDLLDRRLPPAECGGDFSAEAERIGRRIAELHVALAEALGSAPADPAAWAEALRTGVGAAGEVPASAFDALAALDPDDAGVAMRVHGDLHLGQLLQAVDGWHVLDFEGEPLLPFADRTAPSSPLRDLAGMARSLDYAARVTAREQPGPPDDEINALADAWVDRNVAALLDGYREVEGVEALTPTAAGWDTVLDAFVLAKAAYELAYEQRHRPDWVPIPEAALAKLLA